MWRIWAGNDVFLEAAEGLRRSLAALGVAAEIDSGIERGAPWTVDIHQEWWWILVGITVVPGIAQTRDPWPMPHVYVVYQMEQLTSAWLTPAYYDALYRARAVWDFSAAHCPMWTQFQRNVRFVPLAPPEPRALPAAAAPPPPALPAAAALAEIGLASLGAVAAAPPAPPAAEAGGRDAPVDVLFYGCGNPRRVELLAAFKAALEPEGFTVAFHLGFDLFGDDRARAVGNCKVALNAHFYPNAALETHRINYLLQAGACVLSETSADETLDAMYADAVAFAAYDALPLAALALLRDDAARAAASAAAAVLADALPKLAAEHLQRALNDLYAPADAEATAPQAAAAAAPPAPTPGADADGAVAAPAFAPIG